jgi:porphobilinogen deaminase
MELKNMKQKETERVEVYYEKIQKMAHCLQIPTTDSFLTTMFKASLLSYFIIANAGMKRLTLQQHKEVTMLCEERMIIAEARNALSVPHSTK